MCGYSINLIYLYLSTTHYELFVHIDYKQCIIRSRATWYIVLCHRAVRDSTTDSQAILITSVLIYVVIAEYGILLV